MSNILIWMVCVLLYKAITGSDIGDDRAFVSLLLTALAVCSDVFRMLAWFDERA